MRAKTVGSRIGLAAAGIIGGYLLGFLFDPRLGRGRRNRFREKAGSSLRHTGHRTSGVLRDLRNRLRGTAIETRKMVSGSPHDADTVLVQRVRSEVGRSVALGRIYMTASDGRIEVSGDIPARDAPLLVERIRDVRGVRGLENKLTVH